MPLRGFFVDPILKEPLTPIEREDGKVEYFESSDKRIYSIENSIHDFRVPALQSEGSTQAEVFYDSRVKDYEENLHLSFSTHGLDEIRTRSAFIDKLKLSPNNRVLEIGCGTGRDSTLIVARLGQGGELHVQDISARMLDVCHQKLSNDRRVASYVLSDAHYLPYPNAYFDAIYSFGCFGEFAEPQKVFKEMVRVSKRGARVVVGDESVPPWLRKTKYFRILRETNPMFESEVPWSSIPVEARDLRLQYVMGLSFYLIDFKVGVEEPKANFDFTIPGKRGGTYRTRYEGRLEGVSAETKRRAIQAATVEGLSMHDWLEKVIRAATDSIAND